MSTKSAVTEFPTMLKMLSRHMHSRSAGVLAQGGTPWRLQVNI